MHGEGDSYGEPFRLRPDQKLVIYQWFEYEADANGEFVRWRYDELFLECATGYGKTELVAALALAELFGPLAPETPNVPVAAAAYEQADELLGRARQIVQHKDCALRPYAEALEVEIQRKGQPGSIKRIAAVAGTNEGGVPSLFLADEIHQWTGRKERLYTVVRKSLRKRRDGRIICLSTPGEDLDSLAGRLHKVGRDGKHERFLHVWITCDDALLPEINKDDADEVDPEILRTAIRQANPWKDVEAVEDLVRDFPTMPRYTFCRYHLAKWVRVPKESWLKDQPGKWEACSGAGRFDEPEVKSPTVLAWDMSLNRDTTSVSAAQVRADGQVVTRTRIFKPEDFEGGRIDYETVKQHIRSWLLDLGATEVDYDPRLLEKWGQELEDDGMPMVQFPQSPERMSPACQTMYDLIVAGALEHPNDPEVNEHVMNAVKRPTDRGWSLSKRLSGGPIDGCISQAMAISAVLALVDQEPAQLVTF